MKNKIIFGILLVVIVVVVVSFFVFKQTNESIDEEYNIYSVLINSRYISDGIKLIVIEEKTTESTSPGKDELNENYVKQNMPELQQETINDFKKENQQSYLLKRQFDLPVSYILISQKEMKNIFENGKGWDDFYKKYPDSQGTMTLSMVGFNADKNQALVYVGNQGHWLAGAGYYILLVKENNVWKIKKEVMAWIS